MPSPKPVADFVVDLMRGPGGTFEVRAEWRGRSVREPLSVDIEEAVRGLREGAATQLRATRDVRVVSAARGKFRASEVGERLFDALFDDSVRELLGASRASAEAEGLTWRLCLRFQADELARVPWELLYDNGLRSFLAHRHPIVRLPWTGRRARVAAPVRERRILWVGASPSDLPKLDLDREWRSLDRALRSVPEGERPEVSRLEPATPDALLRELRDNRHQILHFAGHGDFEEEEGALILCGADGRSHMLRASDVAAAVADRSGLGVVVLNACEGAVSRSDDARTSVAALLAGHGVPAVVAMQTPIRDDFAAALTEHLYRGLAAGQSVEEAMIEARKTLLALDPGGSEQGAWASPVLWMQWAEDAPVAVQDAPGASPVPWALPVVLWPREEATEASEPEHPKPSPVREGLDRSTEDRPPAPSEPTRPPGKGSSWKAVGVVAALAAGAGIVALWGYLSFSGSGEPSVTVSGAIAEEPVTTPAPDTSSTTRATVASTGTTPPPGGSLSAPPASVGWNILPPDVGANAGADAGTGATMGSSLPPAPAPVGSLTLVLTSASAGPLSSDENETVLLLKGRPHDRAARCKAFTYCAEILDNTFFPVPRNGIQLVKSTKSPPSILDKATPAQVKVLTLPKVPEKDVRIWKHKVGSSLFLPCKASLTCTTQTRSSGVTHEACRIQVSSCDPLAPGAPAIPTFSPILPR